MSRDNFNYGAGKMTNNSRQNQMIRDAAREMKVSERELSEEVHARKEQHYSGDFSYSELLEIARDLKLRR